MYPQTFTETIIDEGASIGANATILPGIRIGRDSMIGAGAIITSDVNPKTIVKGIASKIIKKL